MTDADEKLAMARETILCYECGQSMLHWQFDYHSCPVSITCDTCSAIVDDWEYTQDFTSAICKPCFNATRPSAFCM